MQQTQIFKPLITSKIGIRGVSKKEKKCIQTPSAKRTTKEKGMVNENKTPTEVIVDVQMIENKQRRMANNKVKQCSLRKHTNNQTN